METEIQEIEAIKECSQAILAIHDVMDLLNGKWKVSIISCLCCKKMRYSELLRKVNGISGRMLSRDLKELEMNQLITRTVLNTQPIAIEYEITEYGSTLKNLTATIAAWGLTHRNRIINSTNWHTTITALTLSNFNAICKDSFVLLKLVFYKEFADLSNSQLLKKP